MKYKKNRRKSIKNKQISHKSDMDNNRKSISNGRFMAITHKKP